MHSFLSRKKNDYFPVSGTEISFIASRTLNVTMERVTPNI